MEGMILFECMCVSLLCPRISMCQISAMINDWVICFKKNKTTTTIIKGDLNIFCISLFLWVWSLVSYQISDKRALESLTAARKSKWPLHYQLHLWINLSWEIFRSSPKLQSIFTNNTLIIALFLSILNISFKHSQCTMEKVCEHLD